MDAFTETSIVSDIVLNFGGYFAIIVAVAFATFVLTTIITSE